MPHRLDPLDQMVWWAGYFRAIDDVSSQARVLPWNDPKEVAVVYPSRLFDRIAVAGTRHCDAEPEEAEDDGTAEESEQIAAPVLPEPPQV